MQSILKYGLFSLFLVFSTFAKANQLDSLLSVNYKTPNAKAKGYLMVSSIYLFEKSDTQKAREFANDALAASKASGNKNLIADCFDQKGEIYLALKDDKNALEAFLEAQSIRQKTGNQMALAHSYNNVGRVFLLQEDEADNAIKNFEAAYKIFEANKNLKGLAETTYNWGLAHLKTTPPLYGNATNRLGESQEYQLELEDYRAAALTARKTAHIAYEIGEFENAANDYRSSLEIFYQLDEPSQIAYDLNKLGEVNLADRYYEEAEEFLLEAFGIRQQIGDSLGMAETAKNLAKTYIELKRVPEAELQLAMSSSLLTQIPPQGNSPKILAEIVKIYENLGNTPLAFENQKNYSYHKETVANQEKATALLGLQAKYASQFEADELKNTNNQLLLKQRNTRNMLIFLVLGILLVLGFLWAVYRGYRRKKKDNYLLKTKNSEIANLNSKLVTEMAERESIEQSSFARDRFLATMSHEMRTPLNIIKGLTHLLMHENPKKEQIEHLRTLQFSTNNLVVFINDVLDFSKIEAGKISFDNIAFNPKEIIEEINQRFLLPVKDKKLEYSFEIDEKIPEKIVGDPDRLNQIVTNVIGTSIKYTDAGAIKLKLKIHEIDKNDIILKISVNDTGEGISSENLQKMLQKFSRSEEDIYEGYGSSGLGLAIAKRLAELQNGKLVATSTLGQGSSFEVFLPFRIEQQSNNVALGQDKTYHHLGGLKILLVEDNKINRLVVSKMLEKLHIQVVTASNGEEALLEFDNQYFDLVLMDIQMPIMDGYRATAEIRKSKDPRRRDVPIIALTASAFLTEKEKAKLFGMNDHVGKPFSSEDLLDKIDSLVQIDKTAKIY